MRRREFIKVMGATIISSSFSSVVTASREIKMTEKGTTLLAAPCGLYCGICLDHLNGKCHGCGCDCSMCAGKWHNEHCSIVECVKSKALESCAQCGDLPCTQLIQFTADPIWKTHRPCIENLRRRKRIGTEAWLQEQKVYWQDEENRKAWIRLYQSCGLEWQKQQVNNE